MKKTSLVDLFHEIMFKEIKLNINFIDRIKCLMRKRIKYTLPEDSFERLYTSIYEELQPPEMIEWFPAYRCNSTCQYCGGYDKETVAEFEQELSCEEIVKIVKLSGETGTTIWNIGGRGGEPLLYSRLMNVLQAIKQHNMHGILITNGILLNEEFITSLILIKWDILRISLDSHIATIHDEVRGIGGNFNKIDKALNLLNKCKKDNDTNYPNIICCPVLTSKNYKYIERYVDYCIDKGVNEIQFMPLIGVHERAEKLMLSDNQKKELLDLLKKVSSKNRIRHNINFIASIYKNNSNEKKRMLSYESNSSNKLYCIHLWKTLVISEDGYLSPCSLIKNKLLKIEESHLKAWSNEKIGRLREKVLKGILIDSTCRDCCGPLQDETNNFNRFLEKKT